MEPMEPIVITWSGKFGNREFEVFLLEGEKNCEKKVLQNKPWMPSETSEFERWMVKVQQTQMMGKK